jgi:hypothetical protein
MTREYNYKYVSYPFRSDQTLKILQSSTLDWENYFLDEFCKDFADECISVKSIIEHLKHNFQKSFITQNTLESLSEKFPGIFSIKKRVDYKELEYKESNGKENLIKPKGIEKRVYAINIEKLEKQLKIDKSDLMYSDKKEDIVSYREKVLEIESDKDDFLFWLAGNKGETIETLSRKTLSEIMSFAERINKEDGRH